MDFSTFTNEALRNDTRFETSVVGDRLRSVRKARLANRGALGLRIENLKYLGREMMVTNNLDGDFYQTHAVGLGGLLYEADWEHTNAYCLTYWQFGPGVWIEYPASFGPYQQTSEAKIEFLHKADLQQLTDVGGFNEELAESIIQYRDDFSLNNKMQMTWFMPDTDLTDEERESIWQNLPTDEVFE